MEAASFQEDFDAIQENLKKLREKTFAGGYFEYAPGTKLNIVMNVDIVTENTEVYFQGPDGQNLEIIPESIEDEAALGAALGIRDDMLEALDNIVSGGPSREDILKMIAGFEESIGYFKMVLETMEEE